MTAFVNYLEDEVGGTNVRYNINAINNLFNPSGAKTARERPMSGGIRGIMALRDKALKDLRPQTAPAKKPSISAPVKLPPLKAYNTMGAKSAVETQKEAEKKARSEARKQLIAGLSKRRITYIQSYASLQKLTEAEIKAKIENEFNIQEWRLGGLNKQELTKKYLELNGMKPPKEKKEKKN